jgi:outer membrane receptor protein involved in Fe transport
MMRQDPASNRTEWMLSSFIALIGFMILFAASVPARAQLVGATLSGTITDESSSAVPSATVAITNVATGVTTTVTTNGEGIYSAPNLLPGNYTVTITASGFQKTVQNGVVLTVGAQQVLNLSLKVGSVSQTVEVSTEAPQIQLASSTINGSISSNTISEMPLNGRSWTDLATLQPGVSSIRDIAAATTHDRLGRGLGDQMSIDGGRPQQNNYILNGISINDYSNQAPGTILGENLGADAVSEFTILTSNYSTEYGRSSGGVISAITRSGTNQFHGSVYEYLRNSAMDAANFFDNANGVAKPEFRRNQFGVSAGGPIRKDKTFIFGDYEGLRESKGLSTADIVPSLSARGIAPGGTVPTQVAQVCIPQSSGPCVEGPLPMEPACSSPGSCASDPTTHIDQKALAYLEAFYPLPNSSTPTGNPDTAFYSPSQSQTNSINYFTIRADHKFSEKDAVAGTFTYDKAPFVQPDLYNNYFESNETRRKIVTGEWSRVLSPTSVNTLRFGWSHIYAASPGTATALNSAAASTSNGLATIAGDTAGGVLGISGVTDISGGLSSATAAYFDWNSFQGYDNVSLTKGIHSLRFGFNVERILMTESDCGNCGGNFTFDTLFNFYQNNPLSVIADVAPNRKDAREYLFGGYVQDDIRLRPDLTVNAGLRYEVATIPRELNGKLSTLHSLDGSQIFSGNPIMANPSTHDFEPRIGFSWDPFNNGKTAIRGGFGMFDVQVFPVNLRGSIGAYPFSNSLNSSSPQHGDFPLPAGKLNPGDPSSQHLYFVQQHPKRNYVMQWNLNVQREIAPNTTVMVAYVGSRSVHNLFVTDNSSIVLPVAKTPFGYLWPVPNTAPVPASGLCADGNPPGSPSDPGPGCPWPVLNQNYGRVSDVEWDSDSIFHALELQLSKRMSHGLEAQISYTYGRSEDTSSGSTDGDQFLSGLTSMFFFDKATRRGPSDFDVPHNLTASYTWDIPGPKSVSGFWGGLSTGWELGGIFQVSDGTPFTPLISPDPLGMMGDSFDLPNRVPGCNPVHGGFNYVNTQCFSLPTAPVSMASQCADFPGAASPAPSGQVYCSNLFGSAGRNSILGPRIVNFDMSLVKNTHVTRISESFNVQFRIEAFNIFNHTNFNTPVSSTGCCNLLFNPDGSTVAGAGNPLSTATTSRQLQVALKLAW